MLTLSFSFSLEISMKYLILFFISTYSTFGFEVVLTGEVYSLDKAKKIMTFERHEEKNLKNKVKIKGIFKDLSGNILVVESATMKEGTKELSSVSRRISSILLVNNKREDLNAFVKYSKVRK